MNIRMNRLAMTVLAIAAAGGAAGHVWKTQSQRRGGDGYYVEHCRVVI